MSNYFLSIPKKVVSKVLSLVKRKSKQREERKEILNAQRENTEILARIKKNETINVCFLMLNTSTWKYDSVYQKFKHSREFNVKVVITPLVTRGKENQEKELEQCLSYCEENQYDYLLPRDENGKWMDIVPQLKPDLVFFTNPNPLSVALYHIKHFSESLKVYVPYSIRIDNLSNYSYNSMFNNVVWRNYYETKLHKELASEFSRVKDTNVRVSGHPVIDSYRKSESTSKTIWKSQGKVKKKVIWAPHWTIKGFQHTTLDWAAFLKYAEVMLEIVKEFESEIQMTFKPHPFLKNILENDKLWGKEKTKSYFDFWSENENTQIENGSYVDLFLQSDALIHDSGSFMAEYLELNKPVLYTFGRDDVQNSFNSLGKRALESHYHAHESEEIRRFIKETVIAGNDPMTAKRMEFRKDVLNPEIESSASFIFNDVRKSIGFK